MAFKLDKNYSALTYSLRAAALRLTTLNLQPSSYNPQLTTLNLPQKLIKKIPGYQPQYPEETSVWIK